MWPDASQEFGGPLSGFLAGLEQCETPYLVTVPCDSPLFPLDMVERLADALERDGADMAVVQAPEVDEATGQTALRAQPVFCLMHTSLLESLVAFTQGGGRKIDTWTASTAWCSCPSMRRATTRALSATPTPWPNSARLKPSPHPPRQPPTPHDPQPRRHCRTPAGL